MFDPVVLLTPLLVLVIALLLGFAGCHATVPASPPYSLSVVVGVPRALTVTQLVLAWTDPEGDRGNFARDDPQFSPTEDGNNVFSRVIQNGPSTGPWRVLCRITVREDDNATAAGQAEQDFELTRELDYPTAQFLASGNPSDQTFMVRFNGLTEPIVS